MVYNRRDVGGLLLCTVASQTHPNTTLHMSVCVYCSPLICVQYQNKTTDDRIQARARVHSTDARF